LLDERRERFREVGADLRTHFGTDRIRRGAVDLHPVNDPDALAGQVLDSVDSAHDDVPEVGLVDEQVGLQRLGDAQLTASWPPGVIRMVLPVAKGPEISICSISAFQLGPPVDVGPEPPDRLW
jgi:hypothetical protein